MCTNNKHSKSFKNVRVTNNFVNYKKYNNKISFKILKKSVIYVGICLKAP